MKIERFNGVMFFDVAGITRALWMPRRPRYRQFGASYDDGILVLFVFGSALVIAPCRSGGLSRESYGSPIA